MKQITIEPELRSSETYTAANFLRVHTAVGGTGEPESWVVTIEHLRYRPKGEDGGWRCCTIVDREEMSKADALFIAQSYARQNEIPVIYECHTA